jgi:hypothetical protein
MSIDPENIEVGQCYLMETGQIARVMALLPSAVVQFLQRPGHMPDWARAKTRVLNLRSFAFSAERPVPCDWTLESDECQHSQS